MRYNKFAFILCSITLLTSCTKNAVEASFQYDYKNNKSSDVVKYQGKNKETFTDTSLSYALEELERDKNCAVSPACLGLNYAAVALASTGTSDLRSSLGISSIQDLDEFSRALNWEEKETEGKDFLRSVIFHQIAQDKKIFSYREDFVKDLTQHGIATLQSSVANARKDAETFIQEALQKKLEMPSQEIHGEAVYTYTALTIVDRFQYSSEKEHEFTSLDQKTKVVKGTGSTLCDYIYYEGEGYEAAKFRIRNSELTFLLPDRGSSVSDIPISDAYHNIIKHGQKAYSQDNFFPYFEVDSEINYTDFFISLFQDKGLFDSLVEKETEFTNFASMQKNRFVFNQNGIEGDSVTYSAAATGDMHEGMEHAFVVDRPFIAISSYDNIPLFVMNITSL